MLIKVESTASGWQILICFEVFVQRKWNTTTKYVKDIVSIEKEEQGAQIAAMDYIAGH